MKYKDPDIVSLHADPDAWNFKSICDDCVNKDGGSCYIFGEDADPYIAAAGHFGNKSFDLLKHYAIDLGYEYLSASNKEEFLKVVDRFLTPEITDKPMILEAFTDTQDESDALEVVMNYMVDSRYVVKNEMRNIAKNMLGKRGVSLLKKVVAK